MAEVRTSRSPADSWDSWLAVNRAELFLELQQPCDFGVHTRAGEVLQLSVVLVEARLRACGGMKLKVEIEILIHQGVEGGLGRWGRGHRGRCGRDARKQREQQDKAEGGSKQWFDHF